MYVTKRSRPGTRACDLWGALSARIEADPIDWVFGGLLASAVAAAGLRALYSVTVTGNNLAVGMLGVIPALALCAAAVVVLVAAYWRALTRPGDDQAYLVGAVVFVAALALSIEAFAGLTTLLWRHDVANGPSGPSASVWAAEELYLWHLADAVPLLDVPDTMNWTRPTALSGPAIGAVVVLFRLSIIVPVLGLAVAGYRRCQRAAKDALKLFRDEEESDNPAPPSDADWRERLQWRAARLVPSTFAVCLLVVGVGIVSLLCHAAIRFGIDRRSPLHDVLASPAREGLDVFDRHIELGWVPDSIDILLAATLTSLVVFICILAGAFLYMPLALGSRPAQIASVVAGMALIVPISLSASALSMSLLHLNLATAEPLLDPSHEYGTTVSWYAWNAVQTVPLLDIPDAAGWTLTHHYTDRWNGVLLIGLRMVMAVAVLWPIGLLATMMFQPDVDPDQSGPTSR
jgi:hypothetical protein